MTPELTFRIVNVAALLAWIYLVAAARWTPRVFRVVRYAVPASFAILYVVALVSAAPNEEAGFSSLAGVTALFERPWAVVGGWLHYLAFDFLVGCWILATAKRESIPHWLVLVPLVATFLAGPAGWLLFVILLAIVRRRSSQSASAGSQ